jgi:hypothetical protein
VHHHRALPQQSRIIRPPIPIPPYYRQLLDSAARFRQEGEYAVTVIVAQTACELVVEEAFDLLLDKHGLTQRDREQLRPRSYDLGNTRVKALYALLTKDRIESQTFWSDFKEHSTRRNGIVHKGKQATKQEAKASLQAVTALVTHVETVIVTTAT